MKYVPRLTNKEIVENHKYFVKRVGLYKQLGLDFVNSRKFIFGKAKPLDGNILEIGAGNGYTTLALAKAGYNFISIDNDKESLKKTALNLAYEKLLSKVKFYVMDGTSLSFDEASFHNIVIVNLFHHIREIDKILSEVDRVLCVNGKIIIADFNKRGMKVVDNMHKREGRVHEDFNISKDYICSYFNGLGYKINEFKNRCHWVLIAKKEIHQ